MAEDSDQTRLFIGKLSSEADQQNMRERFQSYGVVQQVNLFRGYAFVHYATEEAARNAIQGENGKEFLGQVINVSIAKPSKKKPQVDYSKQQQEQQQQQHPAPSAAPVIRGGGKQRGRGPGRGGFRGGRGGGGYHDSYRGEQPYPRDDRYHRHPGGRHFDDRPYDEERRYQDDRHRHHGGSPPRRHRAASGGAGSGTGSGSGAGGRKEKKECDCEIICADRACRRYCEYVEKRLKNLGMDVDILFPNPDIPAHKILSNVQSRGVRFAALVTPRNEESRTLTVHVLQGPQQAEHQSLALDDALNALAKAFESALDMESKMGKIGPGENHPQDVLSVIGFMRENRPLSVMEFDRLIKYLVLRREQMLRAEYGDNIPSHLAVPPVGPQADPATRAREDVLKKKVYDILTTTPREAPTSSSEAHPGHGHPHAGGAAPIDPTLQKAIDSLITSGPNLLMNQ